MSVRMLRALLLLPLITLLSGCDWVVMNPFGDIAIQQRDLIVVSTVLMLLIVVPVIFLTLFFAWRYRSSNKEATYDPEWHHSTGLELIIWSAPLLIIIALGAVTWVSTHKLDPYRPLDRIDSTTALDPKVKPLTVEVVALDWKWLFIYPELGIATVNELALPTNVPVRFDITASTVMNSFYVPELAGQIYAMPGMKTQLHAVANKPVASTGFSANFSGAGFTHMRFGYKAMDRAGFDAWLLSFLERHNQIPREQAAELMLRSNPKYVLRNHLGQQAIEAAGRKDFSGVATLLGLLESPFEEHPGADAYAGFPPDWASTIEISCSS
eukprot:TRINITY_DN33431_c0_g2_i3.p1 TRINITY_DN33431_c0_g2~~TRINITY_DN33431_c0_g2_i3.p1  ORF type:complete len:325 (-),score=91.20 TRINITY_DN33431_c0_g2_i3:134-1108(-)